MKYELKRRFNIRNYLPKILLVYQKDIIQGIKWGIILALPVISAMYLHAINFPDDSLSFSLWQLLPLYFFTSMFVWQTDKVWLKLYHGYKNLQFSELIFKRRFSVFQPGLRS